MDNYTDLVNRSNKNNKKAINIDTNEWLPFLTTVVLGIVTLIYGLIRKKIDYILGLQVSITTLIPLIFPILRLLTKKKFPVILNWLITIHIIMSVNFGSALDFYEIFHFWDNLMHSYFGFLASATMYVLLVKWGCKNINRFGFLFIIFISTMGVAALWEVFEFTCDIIFDLDAQRVQESLLLGKSPVFDTMIDIIVAMIGVVVFYILLVLDKYFGHKISSKIEEYIV